MLPDKTTDQLNCDCVRSDLKASASMIRLEANIKEASTVYVS